MTPLRLIAGLGNPGDEHARDRHNVGFRFVDRLSEHAAATLRLDSKCHGLVADATLFGQKVKLLKPQTWMNHSGRAVYATAQYFRYATQEILVVYDELDLPPGTTRIKQGGGHGGHNGIRDCVRAFGGDGSFNRLRIGIGHPGQRELVTPWVLGAARTEDAERTHASLDAVFDVLPDLLAGDWSRAMNALHCQTF